MVLLIAKNFQLVKFSQVDFPIKNPASLRLRMTGQAGTPSGHHFHNETCQKELALIEGLLSPRQRNETEMLSIKKKTTSRSRCGAEVIALEKQLFSIVKTAKKRGPQMRSVGFLFCPGVVSAVANWC